MDILSVGLSHKSGIFGSISLISWQEKLVVLDTKNVDDLFENKFQLEMMIVRSYIGSLMRVCVCVFVFKKNLSSVAWYKVLQGTLHKMFTFGWHVKTSGARKDWEIWTCGEREMKDLWYSTLRLL